MCLNFLALSHCTWRNTELKSYKNEADVDVYVAFID